MIRLALFMNANTKIPQMEMPKMEMSMLKIWYDVQAWQVQFTGPIKTSENDQELKFTFQNIPLLNKH